MIFCQQLKHVHRHDFGLADGIFTGARHIFSRGPGLKLLDKLAEVFGLFVQFADYL